ncbi:MAG: Gfo/Idh/MocA family oxidoreductase [Caldilineaceae bacterium]
MFVKTARPRHRRRSPHGQDAIARGGVLFQTGYLQRGIPAHQFPQAAGRRRHPFGKITQVRASNCHSGVGRPVHPEWLWMTDTKTGAVGAFGDLGTHALDLLLWMFGGVDRVTATLDRAINRYGEDCDETGEGLLVFENGIIGSLAAGWVDVADPSPSRSAAPKAMPTCATAPTSSSRAATSKVQTAKARGPICPKPGRTPSNSSSTLPMARTHRWSTPHEAAYRSSVMEAMYKAAKGKGWVTLS